MIARRPRVVFDTSTLIGALLRRGSPPAQALRLAFVSGEVLVSQVVAREILDVVQRPKFDRYISRHDRLVLIEELLEQMVVVVPGTRLRVCVDPKDDALLELAVDGAADFLVSSDDHLLRLHPFGQTQIVSPAGFLQAAEEWRS